MKKILVLLAIISFTFSCEDEVITYNLYNKPDSLAFKVIYPVNGQKVDKITNIKVFGNCSPNGFTEEIYIYPIVKAPDGNFYPYYKFSINPDNTWDSFLYLGQASDVAGAQFDIYFCAVFRKDAHHLDSVHVPNREYIKSIGTDLPSWCRYLTKISLYLN